MQFKTRAYKHIFIKIKHRIFFILAIMSRSLYLGTNPISVFILHSWLYSDPIVVKNSSAFIDRQMTITIRTRSKGLISCEFARARRGVQNEKKKKTEKKTKIRKIPQLREMESPSSR